MAGRKNPVFSFLNHNKYWIVVIIGVLIVGVLDENSFYKMLKNNMEIADLKEQIDTYNEQYEADEAQLRELRRNPKAITKIARERYFMKADDEDIFVLSTELPNKGSVITTETVKTPEATPANATDTASPQPTEANAQNNHSTTPQP